MVEGGDLAVRNDAVFLKTLSGLVPVDIVLARGAESGLDPLELGGYGARSAWFTERDAIRQRHRDEYTWLRHRRGARVYGVSAATLPTTLGRTVEDAVHFNMVVRRSRQPCLRAAAVRSASSETRVSKKWRRGNHRERSHRRTA